MRVCKDGSAEVTFPVGDASSRIKYPTCRLISHFSAGSMIPLVSKEVRIKLALNKHSIGRYP